VLKYFVNQEWDTNRTMWNKCILSLSALLMLALPNTGAAQKPANQQTSVVYRYADVADLAVGSTVTAHVRLRSAKRVPARLAPDLAPGVARFLISADVIALVRAPGAMMPRLQYLIDVAPDSLGRIASPAKGEAFVFGLPGRPGELRLVRPDAQLPWSVEAAQLVRKILSEASLESAPPRITGIASAYHAAGALPGEGETQIFLDAEGDRPVSLTVSRTPDAPPRWFVSLGEVVDQAAGPPKRNTLLWYRLACTLPQALPAAVSSETDPATAKQLASDYAVVLAGLGPCQRARPKV
jgi:hypothetical protein